MKKGCRCLTNLRAMPKIPSRYKCGDCGKEWIVEIGRDGRGSMKEAKFSGTVVGGIAAIDLLADTTAKPKRAKFGNVPRIYNGIRYQSTFESKGAEYLDGLQEAHTIAGWSRQARYVVAENIEYAVDFVVVRKDGRAVNLEFKGAMTDVYKMKKKLFKSQFPNLTVHEIRQRKWREVVWDLVNAQ